MKLILAAILVLRSLDLAFAGDCKSTANLAERLDCYEAELKSPQAAGTTQQTPIQRHCSLEADARGLHGAERQAFRSRCKGDALSPAMLELRSKLDTVFLKSGIDMDVFALAKKDESTTGKLPQLQLFGYMNRAAIYQIITTLDLIRLARDAGFKSLDMNGKGQGRYIFDLTGAGRVCTRDLCF